jgi:HSP20 family protein
MNTNKDLVTREKQEVKTGEERTYSGKCFVPKADIFETDKELYVVLDMPGVGKNALNVNLENSVLSVEGHIETKRYEGLEPRYTEYNVGHYARSFTLSNAIDQGRIRAEMSNGVLRLTLPKAESARARKIQVS